MSRQFSVPRPLATLPCHARHVMARQDVFTGVDTIIISFHALYNGELDNNFHTLIFWEFMNNLNLSDDEQMSVGALMMDDVRDGEGRG